MTSRRLARFALPGLSFLLLISAAGAAEHHGPRRQFGGGHALAAADLPASELRQRLERLPARARGRALAVLSAMRFAEDELGDLRIDDGGGVAIACFTTAVPAAATTSSPSVAGASVPIGSVPIYHSRPGAGRVAFLDFNGHVISGTAWNSGGKASIPARAFDTDGDGSTFSDAEQAAIQQIWARVAEDYAPFDVDVTTQEPATWTSQCGRILVTPHIDADGALMPSGNAGGVAYVGVFGQSNYATYSPALVFCDNLANRADYIAEAAAHEFGHNCGLSHDGTTTGSAYYGGHGSGATSWGPIMGTGYNENVSQWSRGEYPNANNTEDDLAIIAGRLAYRPDDHGDSAASATPLNLSGTAFSASGVIGTTADIDVFRISVGAGTLAVQATTFHSPAFTSGGDLDVMLRVRDAGGALVAEANPGGAVDASISVAVGAGTYTIEVHGVGDPVNYPSDYASLGQYALTGTAAPGGSTDTTPPSVALTQPAGGTVGGAVALAADASDNVGVARVDFLVDGAVVASDGGAPYQGTWDTTTVANGAHAVWARAVDGAGNAAFSAAVTVTVANGGGNPSPDDVVWVGDATPAGANLAGDGEGWNWTAADPAPFSGALANQSNPVAGAHQHYFWGASATLSIASGDALVAYVWLDPADPPSEVMLQWNDGSWEHRAYWGANQIGWGVDGTASRLHQGALPPAGQWVRLQVPASAVGLEGRTLNGLAFTLFNGRATFDHAGRRAAPTTPGDVVWVEDATPAGANLAGDGEGWSWTNANPTPFSGALASPSNVVAGVHQHYFWGATATLPIAVGDALVAYVFLDPANPPSEVMLQWNDGSWEHRAYWGANRVGWGADGTASRLYQGALPPAGQWVRLQVPASAVGLEGRTLNGLAFTLCDGRATFDRAGKAPATSTPTDVVWVGDATPAGANLAGDGEGWNWVRADPTPFSGALASQSNLVAGVHQHYFWGATDTLSIAAGDALIAYVFLDPANPPSEVMLQWNDGVWEHRAYWGANQVGWGADGTVSRLYQGALPPAGRWVRLQVPASAVGLEGRTLNGMAFTLSGGRATFDHAGKVAGRAGAEPQPPSGDG